MRVLTRKNRKRPARSRGARSRGARPRDARSRGARSRRGGAVQAAAKAAMAALVPTAAPVATAAPAQLVSLKAVSSTMAPPVLQPTTTITAASFFKDFHIDEMIKKEDSMSYSSVGFGYLVKNKLPLAFKFFLEYEPAPQIPEYAEAREQCEKMKYEERVYQALTKAQVNNTVRFVAKTSFPYATAETYMKPVIFNELEKVIPADLVRYAKTVHVTIMERRKHTKNLERTLLETKSDNERLKALVYQIVFTLAVLTQYGIQHNDLHNGNILVDLKPVERYITYQVGGGGSATYKVDVGKYGKVLLFDWDFGYSKQIGPNAALDKYYCSHSGICNTINPRFDLYTILSYISSDDPAFSAFKKAVRGFARIYEDFTGRLCDINPKTPVHAVQTMQRGKNYTIKTLGNTDWFACGYNPAKDGSSNARVHDTFVGSATAACKGTGTVYRKKNITCRPFPAGEPATVMTPLQALRHPYFTSLRKV